MFYLFDRYIAKNILFNIFITLLTLLSLSGIIKFIDQLKKTGQRDYNASNALYYVLLSIPKDITVFFSMSVLIGALIGLGILSQRNEIISMQASGFSYLQIISSIIKTTIPLILIIMYISEFISPKSEQIARNYQTQKIYGSELISIKNGLWAKDLNSFFYIKYLKNSTNLLDINIYIFNNQHNLIKLIHAKYAKWNFKYKHWILLEVNQSNLENKTQIINTYISSMVWKTNFTPDKFFMFILNPDSFSIRVLRNYIKYLKINGQDFKRYQFNMWCKVFQPFSVVVMLLIAVSFIFGILDNVKMGIRILAGIFLGFIFYVSNQILSSLSLIYGFSPLFSAILPTLIFFIISLIFLIKKIYFLK